MTRSVDVKRSSSRGGGLGRLAFGVTAELELAVMEKVVVGGAEEPAVFRGSAGRRCPVG